MLRADCGLVFERAAQFCLFMTSAVEFPDLASVVGCARYVPRVPVVYQTLIRQKFGAAPIRCAVQGRGGEVAADESHGRAVWYYVV